MTGPSRLTHVHPTAGPRPRRVPALRFAVSTLSPPRSALWCHTILNDSTRKSCLAAPPRAALGIPTDRLPFFSFPFQVAAYKAQACARAVENRVFLCHANVAGCPADRSRGSHGGSRLVRFSLKMCGYLISTTTTSRLVLAPLHVM
jgi:hypothetical protein